MDRDFPQNFMFLSVLGYKTNPNDVLSSSSSPLLSWRWDKYKHYTDVHWGCQTFDYPKRSFWCTEFCFQRGSQQEHHIPGTYLNIDKHTSSYKYFVENWSQEHNARSFKEYEIEPQRNLKSYFKQHINEDTVVFYKGGKLVAMLCELCNAKQCINIEKFTNIDITKYLADSNQHGKCKTHQMYSTFCPLERVNFYMAYCNEWLPKYMELTASNLNNQKSVETWEFENQEEAELDDVEIIQVDEKESYNSELEDGEIKDWEVKSEIEEKEIDDSEFEKDWSEIKSCNLKIEKEEIVCCDSKPQDEIKTCEFKTNRELDFDETTQDALYFMDTNNILDYER